MFEDIEDPWTRLERLESYMFQLTRNAEQQGEHLKSQAQMLESMSRHMKDLSIAIMDLYSRENILKQQLEKLK